MKIPDSEILALQRAVALENSLEAYNKLFLQFYSSLKDFACSFLESKQLADEVVSDVFIKIWQKRQTLHTIHHLKMYLFKSTRNTALNYLKREGLQKVPLEDYWVELNSIYFNPERLMITEEMIEKINEAVQSLPARCRLIFKLVKEEGLKYREVAELMDIAVKTVENQMTLALKKIGGAINFDIKRSVHPEKHV